MTKECCVGCDCHKSKKVNVAVILDNSGSMGGIQDATISGFNEYIGNLKKDDIAYRVSVTFFNSVVERFLVDVPIAEVADLTKETYVVKDMTALYDAVYKTIDDFDVKTKTLCVIITDGAENHSKEYKSTDVARKIKELEKTGNFTFVFLGANQDSWNVGQDLGFSFGNVANFNATGKGVNTVFASMAANTRAYSASADMSTQSFYSDDDKDVLAKAK